MRTGIFRIETLAALTLALCAAATSRLPHERELDSDMRTVLETFSSLHPKPVERLSASEARAQPSLSDAALKLLEEKGRSTAPEPVASVRNFALPTAGGTIPARIYRPSSSSSLPIVVYFHGGGWVLGSVDSGDASARALADLTDAMVVSVEYRKAPEAKFPAAADDAYQATQWIMKHAAEIGGDAKRVAVAGEDAGGNLATVVCLMSRDRKAPMPKHQLLISPITDAAYDTKSYEQYGEASPLDAPMMRWFFEAYLQSPSDAGNPYVSPLRADLHDLPPATIITAQIDPLASDGFLYAKRLRHAGVPVKLRAFSGATHEFFGLGSVIDDARKAERFAAAELKEALRE